MQNISGTAENWNKSPLEKRTKELVEEVVVERKEMDPKVLKTLLKKLEDASKDIKDLYTEFPLKNLGDSHIMISSAISSLQKNISRN